MTEEKRRRGRPATGKTKPRQLGRVDDETWEALQSAARESGMTWTAWALRELCTAARRQIKRSRER